MIKLVWLGAPQVYIDGKLLHFETRKIAALFAFLSLNSKGKQREKLAALLWPEYDQTHAMANLRRSLVSLNRTLQISWFEPHRSMIEISADAPIEIDVLEFQNKIQSTRVHPHESVDSCAVCLGNLEEAAKLYRGDFLEGLNLPDAPDFDEWQYLLREELRQSLAWILQELVKSYRRNTDWKKAIIAARNWVRLDQLDLDAQLALVQIYGLSNQNNLALHQVEEYSRLIKDEYGQDLDEGIKERFQEAIRQAKLQWVSPTSAKQDPQQSITALLKTKLYLPRLKPNRVIRSQLISRLKEVPNFGLTLISAPAGFGKTSLLAEWVMQSEDPVAWLSLDAGDNDPARFFSYLCAAFDSQVEGISKNAQSMLDSFQPVQTLSMVAVLINDLTGVSGPFVLVLDDYQFITSKEIHEAVTYLLDHAGPNLHLVIASRADPPIPIARLRSQQALFELRTDDLRFTLEEAVTFFNQTMRLDVAPADVQVLAERTEGWAVGLQMAAISLQGSADRSQFIHTFTGSHRYILEYLIQEVLDRQPVHVRDFLMMTSILERFCGELCECVVGDTPESVYQTLDYLDRSNMFLVPLDEEHRWYRYHHLFADLLLSQLQRFHPNKITDLHRRASQWFEQEGQIDAAIEHASAAKDIERFSALVEKDAQALIYRIEFSKLQKWIDLLPHEVIMKKAWIAITQSWLLLVYGKIPALVDLINEIEQSSAQLWQINYSEKDMKDIATNIASLRAYIAFFSGDTIKSIVLANEALSQINPENDHLRVRLLVQLGDSYLAAQEANQAIVYYVDGIDLAIQIGDFQSTTTALIRMYHAMVILGKLNEAGFLIQRVRKALAEAGRASSPIAGKVELCWGDLLRERGQLEAAHDQLSLGLIHVRQYNIPYDIVTAIVYKAKWFYSMRMWEEAQNQLNEALLILKTRSVPPAIAQGWVYLQALVALARDDLPQVEGFLQSQKISWDDANIYPREAAVTLLAMYLVQQGKFTKAESLLARLRSTAEEKGRRGFLVPIYMLSAIVSHEQGQIEAAMAHLEKCLKIGCAEGYLSSIVQFGDQAAELLQEYRAGNLAKPMAEYVEYLLQALNSFA